MSNVVTVFSSSVLGSFPFQLFGITFENVMELFTASPSVYVRDEQEDLVNKTLEQLVTDYREKKLKI